MKLTDSFEKACSYNLLKKFSAKMVQTSFRLHANKTFHQFNDLVVLTPCHSTHEVLKSNINISQLFSPFHARLNTCLIMNIDNKHDIPRACVKFIVLIGI